MSRHYAIKDRDGTLHGEPNRKNALRDQKAYGGMVVQTKSVDGGGWKAYKRHRVFLWVFLAVQVVFIIWLIVGSTGRTSPTTAQVAHFCGRGAWQGVFSSYADCVKHGAVGLTDAANLGKGIGLALVVIIWLVVDFLLATTYGIYRLAKR
jgi:hypothetical protein